MSVIRNMLLKMNYSKKVLSVILLEIKCESSSLHIDLLFLVNCVIYFYIIQFCVVDWLQLL